MGSARRSATRSAADGAVVAAGYSSNQARADELRQAVEAEGGTLSLHQGNIGDAEDCARVVKDVIEPARPAGHPRQQRGHHRRQGVLEDVRGRLGQGGPGRPIGSVLHGQAGDRAHDRAGLGPDHQHLVGERRDGQHRPGELHGREGRHVRAHQDARQRGGTDAPRGRQARERYRSHGQLHHRGPDRDRHGRHDPAVHDG